jgi:glutamate-1-semialdehyde 2,1-aminomutase
VDDLSSQHRSLCTIQARYGKFFHKMLENGVYLAPSQFEAGFISNVHTDDVITPTVEAAQKAMMGL